MASSSPLLLLLDSVLSNDQDQVHYATNHIHHLCGSTRPSVESLSEIVTKLLLHFPQMASVQSESDGSLPLHFAASLGEVTIAKAIHDKVRKRLI